MVFIRTIFRKFCLSLRVRVSTSITVQLYCFASAQMWAAGFLQNFKNFHKFLFQKANFTSVKTLLAVTCSCSSKYCIQPLLERNDILYTFQSTSQSFPEEWAGSNKKEVWKKRWRNCAGWADKYQQGKKKRWHCWNEHFQCGAHRKTTIVCYWTSAYDFIYTSCSVRNVGEMWW